MAIEDHTTMTSNGVPPEATLAGRTMATLRHFFDQQDHHPSPEHYEALMDIAETLEDMADMASAPSVFLSACDPGLGKSQTLVHFGRALTESQAYRDVGMIIAVGRLTEAESLGRALLAVGVPAERFAIYTSDTERNAIGHHDRNAAQVLITTQQRIERDCDKGRLFADASALFYLGRPRIVRAWDEAFLPGVTITLNRRKLYGLNDPIEHLSPPMAERLASFADSLIGLSNGDHVHVPDWEAEYGVSRFKVADAFAEYRGDEQQTARALMEMGGRRASVVIENSGRATMLTYRDTLPADLAPMIVLDASVRVREVYQVMQEHRGNIEELTSATKDYSPLRVRVWQTSGSKTGFKENHDKLVRGVVDIIETKPNERWLVILHKPSKKVGDIAAAIGLALSPATAANVATLPWGQHMATNIYSDVPNVILAGTLFAPHSAHRALAHLAQDRDVSRGPVSAADVARVERGEHAHVMLQALCRGRVRKSDGAKCLPMDAYIIGATRHAIPAAVRTIFPGCDVKTWMPGGSVLRGKMAEAMAIVEDAMAPGGPGWIAYATVRNSMTPPMDKANFRRNIVNHPDWHDAISGRPWSVTGVGPGGRLPGLRRDDAETLAVAA